MDGFLLSLYAAAGGFTTSNRLSPGRRSQDFDPCSLCGERRTRGGKGIIKDTFQFTLSLRRATVLLSSPPVMWQRFQSTLSLRRATVGGCRYFCIIKNFNPRSPHGERPWTDSSWVKSFSFQSTLSLRRATANGVASLDNSGFQSTLSLRRATATRSGQPPMDRHFNPRSPCGERPAPTGPRGRAERFQSTLSLRRATLTAHVAHGEGEISIHALLAESDSISPSRRQAAARFQSTLSLRRATFKCHIAFSFLNNFNPRSPCGERPLRSGNNHQTHEFQSTLSLRRATSGKSRSLKGFGISIHALLAESDRATREKSRNPS